MAKIKEEDIISVRGKFFHNQSNGTTYPIGWEVRAKRGLSRSFESYGKNANEFPYPVDKLPKAVQAFLEKAKAERPVKAFPMEIVLYQ